MLYDEARAEMDIGLTKSMWRISWQKKGVETYIVNSNLFYAESKFCTERKFKIKPCLVKVTGDEVEFFWTPTLLDVTADDWIVTDER